MSDLTFTKNIRADGALRHWDLRGPAGRVQFEVVDALGIRSARVYLHGTVGPGGAELEPCDVCGRCWIDALDGRAAHDLRDRWAAGGGDTAIRAALERWYTENLAAWAAEQAEPGSPSTGSVSVLFATLVPDMPIKTAAVLAARLEQAGYRLVHTTDSPADHPAGGGR